MNEDKKSYRQILKATSLFGGVQIFQIITTLIRSKFIAIYLGPAGIGFSSLLISSTTMIVTIAGLGLSFSALRDISLAAETGNLHTISRIRKIFFRWIWISGLFGMLATVLLSPQLSRFAFGNNNHTWAFVLLSFTILINTITNGNTAFLQGMQLKKDTAKSIMIGSGVGLFTSLPLYYYYGIQGIVPGIILSSVTGFIISFYFTSKVVLEPVYVSFKATLKGGGEMIKLGAVLMASIFLGNLVTYIINAYISQKGGVADVGLYQAGISVTNQYIGLVFAAMAMDYFPRLTAISADNFKVRDVVNQQATIVILISTPLLIILMLTAPLIIKILLSPLFFPITDFIRWVALGMYFKAASYALGYISFAKGDKKTFFILEGVAGNAMTLALNIISYNFAGLKGLGISFLTSYILYFVAIIIVTRKLYNFEFENFFLRAFLVSLLFCVLTFLALSFLPQITGYFFGILLLIASAWHSFVKIDSKINIRDLISSKFALKN